jgi:hypothetical protein
VSRDTLSLPPGGRGFYKRLTQPRGLERPATEGDSPVGETATVSFESVPSTACHGKTGVNPCGPSHKAKYSWETDSALSSASER